MANERQLTPEEIEQYRAYGRALLQPQEVKHPFMGIANILNALSGRAYMDHAGTNEFMNRTTRGAMNMDQTGGMSVQPRSPQFSSYPPQTGAISQQSRPMAPMPQQAPAPQQPPQIGPFDATTTPEQNNAPSAEQIIPSQETLAPSRLSPRVAEMFGTDNLFPPRQGSPIEAAISQRYGPGFLADIMANPNAPVVGVFHNNHKPEDADRLFVESLPQSLGDIVPDEITGRQWLEMQLNNGPQQQPPSTDGRMPLGGPIETNIPLPTSAQASPDPGVSPGTASMPFRRANPQPRTNSPLPSVPSRGPRTAQADIPSAEGGIEQFAGAIPQPPAQPSQQRNEPTLGFPERIPVNTTRLQAVERMLSNAAILPLDRLTQLEDEYAKLTQPIEVKTQFGTAFYDARTGEFVSSATQPQQITTPVGGAPAVPGQRNRLNIPQIGQQPSAGGPQQPMPNTGGGADMRVPSHPLGEFFGQAEQHAQDVVATRQLSDRATKALNSAMDAGEQAYEIQTTLDLLRTETERAGRFSEGGAFRGPGAQWVLNAKKLLSNFGVTIPGLDSLPPQEQIEKIITQLGSAATRQLSNRPANFEFQTILNAFPGMATSYEGAVMLTDYLQQVQDRAIEIGNMAESLPVAQRGRWNRILREYYEANPIVMTIPAGPTLQRLYGINTPIRVTTKRISEVEERTLPSDTYFFRGGELHRGEGQTR